jgi:uncharacterized protein (DUF1697 family)
MNAKMPELKRAFEKAGFSDVRTLLSSGNVVFSAPKAANASLQKRAESAMHSALGRTFMTFVRPVDELSALLESDPYSRFRLSPKAKRVVTFLHVEPKSKPRLPIRQGEARILALQGTEAFSVYVSGPDGPLFMTLLEKTFGKEITTRTWETVEKAAK